MNYVFWWIIETICLMFWAFGTIADIYQYSAANMDITTVLLYAAAIFLMWFICSYIFWRYSKTNHSLDYDNDEYLQQILIEYAQSCNSFARYNDDHDVDEYILTRGYSLNRDTLNNYIKLKAKKYIQLFNIKLDVDCKILQKHLVDKFNTMTIKVDKIKKYNKFCQEHCPICFDTFSNNICVLPCGHLLCIECFGQLYIALMRKFACQICAKQFLLPRCKILVNKCQ